MCLLHLKSDYPQHKFEIRSLFNKHILLYDGVLVSNKLHFKGHDLFLLHTVFFFNYQFI